jgi:hypothetical protein
MSNTIPPLPFPNPPPLNIPPPPPLSSPLSPFRGPCACGGGWKCSLAKLRGVRQALRMPQEGLESRLHRLGSDMFLHALRHTPLALAPRPAPTSPAPSPALLASPDRREPPTAMRPASDRLGSARLGSARLGSARMGSTRALMGSARGLTVSFEGDETGEGGGGCGIMSEWEVGGRAGSVTWRHVATGEGGQTGAPCRPMKERV